MGLIQNFIDSAMNKRRKFSEMKEDDALQEKLQQRKLSANEREYNRYLEEQRQEYIKRQLQKFRKQKQDEFWHKDTISQPFIFKGTERPIATQGTILGRCDMKGGAFFR